MPASLAKVSRFAEGARWIWSGKNVTDVAEVTEGGALCPDASDLSFVCAAGIWSVPVREFGREPWGSSPASFVCAAAFGGAGNFDLLGFGVPRLSFFFKDTKYHVVCVHVPSNK